MKIKYSFVIPVYGCEQYLEACVESILSQKGDHAFEIILVDDGSKDRSGQIADMLARKDSRIRTFHKENGGAASARNFGLQQVTGDYVLFIDSDDTVEDQLLNHVDEALAEHPEALVIFGMAFDFYRGERLNRVAKLSCKHEGKIAFDEVLSTYRDFFNDNSLSSACNKVFSLKTIQQYQLAFDQNLVLYEDLIFTINYMRHIDYAVFLPICFYHYRVCLEKNRYGNRISNLKNVNYMLSEMQRSMCYIATKDSLEIRRGILQQIMTESLSDSCFHIRIFLKKASDFKSCSAFINIYSELINRLDEIPPVFALINSGNYTRLWAGMVYRKLRRILVSCLKCGGVYVILFKKWILEKMQETDQKSNK